MSKSYKAQNKSLPQSSEGIAISWPYLYLIVVSIILYGKSIVYGFTLLDDSIFIVEFHDLNKKLSNFFHLFQRGVFHEAKDTYYRPLLMVSFMFDAQVGGVSTKVYHVTNLLLHIISVCLVYRVLIKLNTSNTIAFLFALLFAVHPAISQAVAWVPGRNDSLLCVFFLSGFISFVNYHQTSSYRHLALFVLFAMLSAFTKETGTMLPIISLAYMFLMPGSSNNLKKILPAVAAWLLIIGIYLVVRTNAVVPEYKMGLSEIVQSVFARVLIPIQYIGKVFFPFNLSVFPIMEDTTVIWGILSLVLLGYLFFKIHKSEYKAAIFGLFWFLILIFPALVVPKEINDQVFEHRLYVPLIGIFILASQFLSQLKGKQESKMFYSGLAVIAVYGAITFVHIDKFKKALPFWENAVKTSPHSANAHALLSVRYLDANKIEKARSEAEQTLKLNPKEKYGNYVLGRICVEEENFQKAETYFKNEISLERPYFDAYFRLGHVSFMLNKKDSAAAYLEKYIAVDSFNTQAYNNLMLLYMEQGKYSKALEKAYELGERGEVVDEKMMKNIKDKMKLQDSLVVDRVELNE